MDLLKRKALAASLAVIIAVPAEGLRRIAYYDPPGILTVCYGHTGPDIDREKTYSLAECDALLTKDMHKAIDQVERCVPGLPENMLAAWGDAVYNLGPAIVCNAAQSTAARMLRDPSQRFTACAQLSRWDKARIAGVLVSLPGLTKRRAAERELCESTT